MCFKTQFFTLQQIATKIPRPFEWKIPNGKNMKTNNFPFSLQNILETTNSLIKMKFHYHDYGPSERFCIQFHFKETLLFA
jgi:hypothetical protein